MSEIFNIKRFAGYTAKIYKENSHKYLMYVALVLSIQAGGVLIMRLDNGNPHGMLFYIMWMSLILGILFAFSEMKPFRNRHTAIMNNTLPVSYFEKFLLIILNTTLVYTIIYWGIFFIITLALSNIFNYGDMTSFWLGNKGALSQIRFITGGMSIFIPIAIFAGTTNIKNHLLAFLIVMVIAIPLIGSTIYLPGLISGYFFDGIELGYMFNGFSVQVESAETCVEYSTNPIFGKFFSEWRGRGYNLYMWAMLLLVTGYFKFKERQIK
ncbi:MAG: hypothetical protein WCZ43_02430 [Proteiniphilum sp.]